MYRYLVLYVDAGFFFNYNLKIIIFNAYGVLPACMFVCCLPTWYLWKTEEDMRFFETVGTDSCESTCEYWELNLGQ